MLHEPGGRHPVWCRALPDQAGGGAAEFFGDGLPGGPLRAVLTAGGRDEPLTSDPVWVVREADLTRESADGPKRLMEQVETTGEGLVKFLDDLGRREGTAAVAEVLRRLRISAVPAVGGRPGRRLRLRPSDPHESDGPPAWAIGTDRAELAGAVKDFLAWHFKYRLRTYAKRGDANTLPGFLNILRSLTDLAMSMHQHGVLKRLEVVGAMCGWIEAATFGTDRSTKTRLESPHGLVAAVLENHGGDPSVLRAACAEVGFWGELQAVLEMVQRLRYTPGEPPVPPDPPARGPADVLRKQAKMVERARSACGVGPPPLEEVREALNRYSAATDV